MEVIFTMFCRDIDEQLAFYQTLFRWPEAQALRSPIFRALKTSNTLFGFHAPAARQLLNVGEESVLPSQAGGFPTIHVAEPAQVDALTDRTPLLLGAVIKSPFATYYGQWQAVLRDPEGNLLRVACAELPPGVQAPRLRLEEAPS